MPLVTIDDVRAAAARIAGRVVRTPLLPHPDRSWWVKPESLQPTGAFKLRGATNAISRLPAGQGVVTHSSGNHARAVAFAARLAGVPATIVMPDNANPVKVAAVRALGATVRLVPPKDREATADAIAAEHGLALVPPFDHPDVIAGQGTVGLEITADLPDVDVVLTPVGGGGMLSGVAVAIKALLPSVKVIGVEPELAGDAAESFLRGERVTWEVEQTARTIADGLRLPSLGELTWAHIHTLADDIVTVSEGQILEAIRVLATDFRLVAEPSGAVAAAGYLFRGDRLPAGRTVTVVTGGVIAPAFLAEVLS